MDVIEKLKILKKNSLYAEFLHKYPSSYILKKNKKLINIESINSNNNLLYIHIPFCLYVCDFCSVNKTKLLDYNLVLSYLKTLYEEIDHYSKIVKGNISGVYIGGGTPTILMEKDLDNLFELIKKSFTFSENINIEIDAYPVTLTKGKLDILQKHKVNQLTMGIQSLEKEVLEGINRKAQNHVSLENLSLLLKDYSFNLHFDFVIGLPGENLKNLKNDIIFVIENFSPFSVSLNGFENAVNVVGYEKYKPILKSKEYKNNITKNVTYLDKFINKKYGLKRRETFYFENFHKRHYNVIGMGAGAFGFVKGGFFMRNFDYNEYIKYGFVKTGISTTDRDEKIMFIHNNYHTKDINENYRLLFGSNIIDSFRKDIDYYILKGNAVLNGNDVKFTFKSDSVANFEFISLYTDNILNNY